MKIMLSIKVTLMASVFAKRDIYTNRCTLVCTKVLQNNFLQFIKPYYFWSHSN